MYQRNIVSFRICLKITLWICFTELKWKHEYYFITASAIAARMVLDAEQK